MIEDAVSVVCSAGDHCLYGCPSWSPGRNLSRHPLSVLSLTTQMTDLDLDDHDVQIPSLAQPALTGLSDSGK